MSNPEDDLKEYDEAYWMAQMEKMEFPNKVRLSVIIAALESHNLSFHERKDIIAKGVTLYAHVYAIEIISNILGGKRLKGFDDHPLLRGMSNNERMLFYFAAWAEAALGRSQKQIDQFLNLVDVLVTKESSE